jgi:hypothetical protein
MKESLDNRSRSWMSVLDHTGSTNSAIYAGKGYGLEQSAKGVKTNSEGIDFAFGQLTTTLGGKK